MFTVNIIEAGYIMADGGAMFGSVPKRAWMRKYESDENNLCPLAMRCVLAVSKDRKILIDTGMGNKHAKEVSYYQPYNLVDISVIIRQYGCTAEEITDVVLTHLHFDHCGGATYNNEKGDILPTFPNARYWLSRKQWDSFNNPNRLEKDSFFADNILPIHQSGLLHLVDSDMELCDGLQLCLFDGHTTGQLVAIIDTHRGINVFAGDVIPTSSHIPLEWISAYDICALTSIKEKEKLLHAAVTNDWTLIYCHDKNIRSSKIKRLNDNYKAIDLLKTS